MEGTTAEGSTPLGAALTFILSSETSSPTAPPQTHTNTQAHKQTLKTQGRRGRGVCFCVKQALQIFVETRSFNT